HRSGETLIGAFALPDADVRGTERSEEKRSPVQRSSRNAAEDVDAGGPVFRKCMNREMRLLQKPDAGYSAALRKCMPDRPTDRLQFHTADDLLEQLQQLRLVSQSCIGAAKGFDEPLNSSHSRG